MGKGTLRTLTAIAVLGALVVGGGALLAGCSSSSSSTPGELQGTWLLQAFALDDGSTVVVGDPQNYSINFSDDRQANIKADCNLCNGTYFLDENSLRFGTMACTLAACGPDSLDSAFVRAIATTSRYEIVDGRLVLDYEGGNMSFTRAAG
jgi:heat shock protein HslJ